MVIRGDFQGMTGLTRGEEGPKIGKVKSFMDGTL